ncbi:g535 [Coccomyxa viridis]|uniref:G535 protein n=1 Tax=Coccomyxa viridis TaxID=1274662 RepID=A0ABP1FJY3_9CHLO
MYILITLSDLEADYLNPHDSSVIVNYWLVPEYLGQGVITLVLLLTGKWVAGLLSLGLTAYHIRAYMQKEHVVDVTEVFRQIPRQKMIRIVKLVIYLVSFVYFIFRTLQQPCDNTLGPALQHGLRTILSLVNYFDAAYPILDRHGWQEPHVHTD